MDEKYHFHDTRGTDNFLARPGRKQFTANKLGIYSTYPQRSSINFLARCSNFCKPLKKNIVRPTRSPRQQWPPRRTKNGEISIFFQSRKHLVFRRTQIRRIGWVIKTLEAQSRPVSTGLQVPGEPRHCRTKTRQPCWNFCGFFPLQCTSICHRNILGWGEALCRHSIDCCFVSGS